MADIDRSWWIEIIMIIIKNLPEIIDIIDGDDEVPLVKAP